MCWEWGVCGYWCNGTMRGISIFVVRSFNQPLCTLYNHRCLLELFSFFLYIVIKSHAAHLVGLLSKTSLFRAALGQTSQTFDDRLSVVSHLSRAAVSWMNRGVCETPRPVIRELRCSLPFRNSSIHGRNLHKSSVVQSTHTAETVIGYYNQVTVSLTNGVGNLVVEIPVFLTVADAPIYVYHNAPLQGHPFC
jgi:hypothetical protein